MKVWELKHREKYKGGRNATEKAERRKQREQLIAEQEDRTGEWLRWEAEAREACVEDDDALDAVLSAFVARAGATHRTRRSKIEHETEFAPIEGLATLPKPDSLEGLACDRVT